MENIALIGIDLGKNSFHVHCQDRHGKAVYRKKFTRPKLIEFLVTCPATTIEVKACGGSYFMTRKLTEPGYTPKHSSNFAAATGLVPCQYSTGGRTILLAISKQGNKKIRTP